MPFATEDLAVTIRPDGLYRLTADLIYQGRDDTFTVPAGFLSDLASVPRALTALVPIAGKWDRAAVVHDWLCVQLRQQQRAGVRLLGAERHRAAMRTIEPRLAPVNPVDVDGIFRRMLRELGVPVILRWLFWTGVRWGAVTNPARRAGWCSTALPVLGISVAAAPVVVPVAIVTGLALAIGTLAEVIASKVAG